MLSLESTLKWQPGDAVVTTCTHPKLLRGTPVMVVDTRESLTEGNKYKLLWVLEDGRFWSDWFFEEYIQPKNK